MIISNSLISTVKDTRTRSLTRSADPNSHGLEHELRHASSPSPDDTWLPVYSPALEGESRFRALLGLIGRVSAEISVFVDRMYEIHGTEEIGG
jgi:hypothetical protein